jgi:hypothetical protein
MRDSGAIEAKALYTNNCVILIVQLLVTARTGSAGLLAGCRVDLPVHASLYNNKRNALKVMP